MLKIKNNIKLDELVKFGFEKYVEIKPTWRSSWSKEKDKYIYEKYTELGYKLNTGVNIIYVVEEYINDDWHEPNEERQIYVCESDYNMGVDIDVFDILFELIQAGFVEKV